MATYYSMDLRKFKETLGIKGYISPNSTFNEIAEEHGIPRERILAHMNPLVRFNGWVTILTDRRFVRSIVATALLTVSSVFVGGFLGVATGSVLARFRKRWHQWVYNLYMLQMIIPPIMIIVPVYIILARMVGLRDSYWALFLLFIKGGAISTLIFTSYLSTIPGELKESVDIDGGNRFHYFFYVLFPLARVPFASYMAIHFPVFWNELLHGLLFLSPEKYTLVPLINAFQGTFTTNYQAIYAGLAISVIPILIVYLVFQNLFVRSALAGAIKG
ncbi:MAG: carbohydrate ABC transporter permease [Spirochaetaceae bacterium]|nr:carbohydrate ABC transporter permease [Spirochaetaceae bacterium]